MNGKSPQLTSQLDVASRPWRSPLKMISTSLSVDPFTENIKNSTDIEYQPIFSVPTADARPIVAFSKRIDSI